VSEEWGLITIQIWQVISTWDSISTALFKCSCSNIEIHQAVNAFFAILPETAGHLLTGKESPGCALCITRIYHDHYVAAGKWSLAGAWGPVRSSSIHVTWCAFLFVLTFHDGIAQLKFCKLHTSPAKGPASFLLIFLAQWLLHPGTQRSTEIGSWDASQSFIWTCHFSRRVLTAQVPPRCTHVNKLLSHAKWVLSRAIVKFNYA
jgi:hypothetical protein